MKNLNTVPSLVNLTSSSVSDSSVWAIVLAGGEGRRMEPAIRRWLGQSRPKQYCAFTGTRSMLRHTLDRAAALVSPSRIVTSIGPGHKAFLDSSLSASFPGLLIEQRVSRGTAAGIFASAACIMNLDPEAVVLVFPSDHYVYPESRFIQYARSAVRHAESFPQDLVLLGALPTGPESDYGWIETSLPWNSTVLAGSDNSLPVRRFFEKPAPYQAAGLFRRGCLWNTMVFAVHVKTLWNLGHRYLPDLLNRLDDIRTLVSGLQPGQSGSRRASRTLDLFFLNEHRTDFSRDILQKMDQGLFALALDEVDWSDWGRPERIEQSLARLGKVPYYLTQESSPQAKIR